MEEDKHNQVDHQVSEMARTRKLMSNETSGKIGKHTRRQKNDIFYGKARPHDTQIDKWRQNMGEMEDSGREGFIRQTGKKKQR
eukprot:6353800-Heterocapsa_arctica.AAC.1